PAVMHNRWTAAKSHDQLAENPALTWTVILPSSSPLEGSQPVVVLPDNRCVIHVVITPRGIATGAPPVRDRGSERSSSPLEGSQRAWAEHLTGHSEGVVITPRGIATSQCGANQWQPVRESSSPLEGSQRENSALALSAVYRRHHP